MIENKNEFYSNAINQTVDILLEEKLKRVSFDRTIVGEIISQVENSKTKYWVKAEGIKFEAQAQDDTKKYLSETQVYVLIPGGDYSREKIILGAYTVDKAYDNIYTNPFDKMISAREIELDSNSLQSEVLSITPTALADCNRFGVKLALETDITADTNFSIEIYGTDNDDNTLLLATISKADFWGNPNQLRSAFKFYFLFEIPNNVDISTIKRIKAEISSEENISISECFVYFGFDKSLEIFQNEQDTVVLDLDDGDEMYSASENKEKHLSLTWSHYDSETGKYEIFDENNPFNSDNYTIYWCRKNQALQGYQKKENGNNEGYNDIEESGVYWQTIYQGAANNPEAYYYNSYIPDTGSPDELLKVVIKKNSSIYYTSNTLEFFNSDKVEIEQKLRSLSFSFDGGSNDGTYNPYSSAAALMDRTSHNVSVSFVDEIKWNEATEITWTIPKNAQFTFDEDKGYSISDNNNGTTSYTLIKSEGSNLDNVLYFKFKEDGYNSSANNTLTCKVKRKDISYIDSCILNIGKGNNNGTNYQFNAVIKEHSNGDNIPVLTFPSAETETFLIKPELRDNNGQALKYDFSNIEYEWYQEGNSKFEIITDEDTDKKDNVGLAKVSLKRPSGEAYSGNADDFNYGTCKGKIPKDADGNMVVGKYYFIHTIKKYNTSSDKDTYSYNGYYVKLYTIKIEIDSDGEIIETESRIAQSDKIKGENKNLFDSWYPIKYISPQYCTVNQLIHLNSSALSLQQNEYVKDAEGNIREENGTEKTRKDSNTIGLEEKVYGELEDLDSQLGATGEIAHNAVLKITLKDWLNTNNQNINLCTYVPIALRSGKAYKSLQGATEIAYDYSGHSYQMNQDYYNIPDETEKAIKWNISAATDATEGLPSLIEEKDEKGQIIGYKLSPSTQMSSTVPPFSVVAKDQNENVLWIQPVIVYRDRYPFEVFNTWDSSLTINEQDNYILSSFVGAGKKDQNNAFTGVFMGDIGGHIDGMASAAYKRTGLYGVQKGELRFKFDEKGEAYIGTGANNHISFANGEFEIRTNKLFVQTDNLLIDSEGNNGTIIQVQKDNGDEIFSLDKKGNAFFSGKIEALGGKIGGWNIDSTAITNRFYDNGITYYSFMQAKSGTDSHVFDVRQVSGNYMNSNPETWNYKFYVRNDGYLYSTSGKIGGWNIYTNKTFDDLYLGTAGNVDDTVFISQNGHDAYVQGIGYKKCIFYSKGNFAVDANGKLYAREADIEGTISAKTGNFSNSVTIGGTSITAGNLRQMYKASQGYTSDAIQIKRIEATSGNIGGWTINKDCLSGEMYDGEELGDISLTIDPFNITYKDRLNHYIGSWRAICKAHQSDERLKNNILNISAIYNDLFDQLSPKTFNYKKEAYNGSIDTLHFGFIAQDILQIANQLDIKQLPFVFKDRGYYHLDYIEFIALNTWQIQKLKARVAELEKEIKEIKQNEI